MKKSSQIFLKKLKILVFSKMSEATGATRDATSINMSSFFGDIDRTNSKIQYYHVYRQPSGFRQVSAKLLPEMNNEYRKTYCLQYMSLPGDRPDLRGLYQRVSSQLLG